MYLPYLRVSKLDLQHSPTVKNFHTQNPFFDPYYTDWSYRITSPRQFLNWLASNAASHDLFLMKHKVLARDTVLRLGHVQEVQAQRGT